MNKYELEHDRQCAIAFKRLPCTMLLEKPYYPWLHDYTESNYTVNFALTAPE